MQKNKTVTINSSRTKTHIATTMALFFLVGGLAFLALPKMQVKKVNSLPPAVQMKNLPKNAAQVKSKNSQNEVPITLVRCGNPEGGWQSGKHYILSQDITPPVNTAIPCFNIVGNNIILDGQNHTIRYQDSGANIAIRVEESSVGITLKNLHIRGFQENAISVLRNAINIKIQNNVFEDNRLSVSMLNSNSNEISGNTFRFTGQLNSARRENFMYGIKLFSVQGSSIINNTFENLILGLKVDNSSSNTFERNVIRRNVLAMQIVEHSNANIITQSTFENNYGAGIIISDSSSQNLVASSTFVRNGGGSSNVIGKHVINDAQFEAPAGLDNPNDLPVDVNKMGSFVILGDRSEQNIFQGNTIDGALSYALYIENAPRTSVVQNQVINGITSSLHFKNTRELTFSSNTLRGNSSDSRLIYIEGAGTFGLLMNSNTLCGNSLSAELYCEQQVNVRDGFRSAQNNRIEQPIIGSCASVFVGGLSC